MSRVVSDDVKRKVWLFQPVSDHGLLPGGQPAVQVPRHHDGHRGVQHGQKPPDHPEDVLQVTVLTGALYWANIKTREGNVRRTARLSSLRLLRAEALEAAELLHRSQAVGVPADVEPEDPAWVELREEI